MLRYPPLLLGLLLGPLFFGPASAADNAKRNPLKDLYFGEALYDAYQGDHFDAIARLDTELGQYHGLDEPQLDTLYFHINEAEFFVGDFELSYRMHLRSGRAIKAVLEGNVKPAVRNEAAVPAGRRCTASRGSTAPSRRSPRRRRPASAHRAPPRRISAGRG